jgi:glycosyltransferase involved in cell wall biosynthesis
VVALTEDPALSVVIPAYDAERTLGLVLAALLPQLAPRDEVIVVDDGSRDGTAAVAREHGARVVETDHRGYAGGARNRGWEASRGDVVVFLDADVEPNPGWADGVRSAVLEFPGAIIGCARTFAPTSEWQWVAHLQTETPYLPRGAPRDVRFVSSYCMVVPRDLEIRFDESYGGEDALFCVDALAREVRLVFDPRFSGTHHHGRESFAALRRMHDRLAYGAARMGPAQREGLRKRVFSRVPVHYFALARLPLIWRRLDDDPELRRRFVQLLPRLVLAEWAMGVTATRYAVRARPPLRGQAGPGFR